MSLEAMAQQGMLEQAPPQAVAGWSLGRVASQVAIMRPERAQALVMVAFPLFRVRDDWPSIKPEVNGRISAAAER